MQNDKEKFKNEFTRRLTTFSVETLHFADKIKSQRTLWPIADQLVRSASSIGANVVEARSASSKKDYTNFFVIALKSANETKYWFTVIKEYSPQYAQQADQMLKEVEEIAKIIGSSVLTLKGKK